MQQPLISVLIPFKNTEKYIDECLQSILGQSYFNFEVVIIDDHSTDNSYSIVEKHAQLDSRIRLFKNDGFGIIDALRTAFKNSNGDYITRMDSDDIMTLNRLKIMLESLIIKGRQHLAVGKVNYFREDGLSEGFSKYESWLNKLITNGTNYTEIYKECVIPSPCWMLHREDFIACGGFDSNRYPEDYDLAFRFYKAGYTCIPCNEVLLLWRDYSSRTSRTHHHYAENHFLELKIYYFLMLDYNTSRPLSLWGAGSKGKTTAKLLIKHAIPFYWICDNPKKIGKDIYGKELLNFDYLKQLQNPQSIVTVANSAAQNSITQYFRANNMKPMLDYFFFC